MKAQASTINVQPSQNGSFLNRTIAVLAPVFVLWLTRELAKYADPVAAKELAGILTDQLLVELFALSNAAGMYMRSRHNKATLPKVKLPRGGGPGGPAAAALVLGLLLSGCGATWPASCRQGWGEIACTPRKASWVILPHPSGKGRPAGRLVLVLDGAQAPVVIDADDVVRP